MSTYTGGVLFDGTLVSATPGAETTLYTASGSIAPDCVSIKNVSATTSCALTVWVVPSGGAATSPIDANMIFGPALNLPPKWEKNIADLIKRLDNGDKIVALAGAANMITMRGTGVAAT